MAKTISKQALRERAEKFVAEFTQRGKDIVGENGVKNGGEIGVTPDVNSVLARLIADHEKIGFIVTGQANSANQPGLDDSLDFSKIKPA